VEMLLNGSVFQVWHSFARISCRLTLKVSAEIFEMFLFALKDEAFEVRKANFKELSEPEISP
jgi:hypothetical protein